MSGHPKNNNKRELPRQDSFNSAIYSMPVSAGVDNKKYQFSKKRYSGNKSTYTKSPLSPSNTAADDTPLRQQYSSRYTFTIDSAVSAPDPSSPIARSFTPKPELSPFAPSFQVPPSHHRRHQFSVLDRLNEFDMMQNKYLNRFNSLSHLPTVTKIKSHNSKTLNALLMSEHNPPSPTILALSGFVMQAVLESIPKWHQMASVHTPYRFSGAPMYHNHAHNGYVTQEPMPFHLDQTVAGVEVYSNASFPMFYLSTVALLDWVASYQCPVKRAEHHHRVEMWYKAVLSRYNALSEDEEWVVAYTADGTQTSWVEFQYALNCSISNFAHNLVPQTLEVAKYNRYSKAVVAALCFEELDTLVATGGV